MTTLADLKAAISRVEVYERAPLHEALEHAVGWTATEREAWKTAFAWLRDWNIRSGSPDADVNALLIEYNEAMAIIEKLK